MNGAFIRPTRRKFLTGVAAATGAAALLERGGLLKEAWAQPANPRAIDCHHHFLSPAYIKTLGTHDGKKVNGYTTWFALDRLKDYTVQKDLEAMDRDGCATAMLSCTTPGIWFGDPEESTMLAREMNEFGARQVTDHKGRFGLFALLPLPSIEKSLKEIEYAFDTLHADGVGLVSSYGNVWLGDPLFRPVFDELNRRRAVVYVHPIDAPCCQELMPNLSATVLEYNQDTARSIYSLLYTGAATRYNNINFIWSHGGGTLPGLTGRFGLGTKSTPDVNDSIMSKTPEVNSKLYHLRRFHYDTAGSANIVQMTALKLLVGASQIVIGTDYPFGTVGAIVRGLQKCGFTAAELQGIYRDNAVKFMPKYA
jgi:predicted TIM-barrel fold metal-dependent hydrolase